MMEIEKEWVTEAGYPAQVVAHPAGHRCGYVTVPDNHPCYGVDYDECMHIEVHGGLTFADGGTFGFDCAHYDDAPDPALMSANYKKLNDAWPQDGAVRTLDYCIEQCESMARQFKALEEKQEEVEVPDELS
jgi:hypothetical protein